MINPAKFGNHTIGCPQLIPSTVKSDRGQNIFEGKNARVWNGKSSRIWKGHPSMAKARSFRNRLTIPIATNALTKLCEIS